MESPIHIILNEPNGQRSDASPTSTEQSEHEHDEDDIFGNKYNALARDDAHARRRLLGGEEVRRIVRASNWSVIRRILLETCPTLLFTTIGMVFAGELLEQIAGWKAFRTVDELLILVPILINLKGNIEMNLSARLSTSANIGALDTAKARRALVVGNLWLLQVQALAVSAVAAAVSFALGAVGKSKRKVNKMLSRSGFLEFTTVLSCALSAASLSAVILGSFMCALVLLCRRWQLDPDNITSPLAACLGDLLTLSLLALLASVLLPIVRTPLPALFSSAFLLVAFLAFLRTRKNPDVRALLSDGWSALFAAMLISACAGMLLDWFVRDYEGFGMMAIVIGGLPGSVGSVFVSRLSTALHSAAEEAAASDPESTEDGSSSGVYLKLEGKTERARERPVVVGLTLLAVSLPVALLYLAFVWVMGWMSLPPIFVLFFVLGFIITTALSLLAAYALTHLFWRFSLDPDTYCLPLQSSLVDLIGPAILVLCYEMAEDAGAQVIGRHQ
ncbi:MgtE-domain-containing protein [Dacryopinax primogenitus]|uniref:MgtE-domain-containing protein n=1 Tax=Dacryopinax primogenitus (strain DJM 731) TaxID=1858805 RepID=M5GBP3_DACPD|nr:MgtE-domain-containing protein [Dacryopinax primogenitus]EJU05840.1 MgtE-domain-containing protein [Dacryopinax primogenitus]